MSKNLKENVTLTCNCEPCTCAENAKPTKRIQILGNAFTVTSNLKFETIQKLEKYDDQALCLKELSNDEEKELFRISTGKIASISKYGITFAEANKAGYATATMLFPESVKDKKEYIKDNFANTLFMLNEVEHSAERACLYLEKAFAELDEIIEEI